METMSDKYILNDLGEPIPALDLLAWAQWFETSNRKVAMTEISRGVKVSTVFLGLAHGFDGNSPILWETMVFGGPNNQEMDRCSGSRKQAEAMHEAMILKLKGAAE